MMGIHQQQKDLFSYGVDLDKRVRKDHPLRMIREKIDFSFVREEVEDKYGANGNVSIDPEVTMKLMFLLFWDNVFSERALMRMLPERLDYLCFLGYGLDDDTRLQRAFQGPREMGGRSFRKSFYSQRHPMRRSRTGRGQANPYGRQPRRRERVEGFGREKPPRAL